MAITYQKISFQDIIDGSHIEGDIYGIAQRSLLKARKDAFLANPFLEDKNATMLLLAKVDDVVCGKRMFYPTKVRANGDVINTLGGSNYYVHPDYRKYALGGSMIMSAAKKANIFMLSAGCSPDSLKIYEAMKAVRFLFPQYTIPTRLFPHCRIKGLRMMAGLLKGAWNNTKLIAVYKKVAQASKRLNEQYVVKELSKVPEWAEAMVLNDGHSYMEYHNKEWLQWNLDYNFGGGPETGNLQKFFALYEQEQPIGFFMITERIRKDGNIGFVQEWQTANPSKLSDADLLMMAICHFSENVDYITIATAQQETQTTLLKYGFVENGKANIVLKDLLKKYEDVGDINKWRIRLGYADFIMS